MSNHTLSKLKNIIKRTDNWLMKANLYMYNFKDGHFQFPYFSNEPELMIEGIKNTPFVTHNAEMQSLETDTPFVKIKLKYLNISEGFWMTATRSNWKVKVKVMAIPDEEESDYYFLTYSRTTDNIDVFVKGKKDNFENNSLSWTLYKSTTALDAYFKKGAKVFTTLFIFNKTWFEENILTQSEINSELALFVLNQSNAYKTYLYGDTKATNDKFIQLYGLLNDVVVSEIDLKEIKKTTITFISDFFNIASKEKLNEISDSSGLTSKDRLIMDKLELHLKETLTQKFEGIDELSIKFKISPTKLKTDFKLAYGMTILHYYQTKQMELAIELLKKKIQIKEIAQLLGYSNVSKFGTRFEEVIGVLPSKYF